MDVAGWLNARKPDDTLPGRLTPGVRVGEWRVEAYLGAGISAEVYRVTHVRYGRAGALKLLTNETFGLRERFLSEADAIRFLSLKALPRYMGAGEYEGKPYYVMEHLQPLPDPMPRREVPRFMNRVAKAVQMLHEAGYIHRDLKPGNVLLRADGEPVLIDLGLVKRRGMGVTDCIVRHGRGISIIDGKPVGVGTLDYAAPEQLLKGEASVQSDVFALGKMLRGFYGERPPQSVKSVIRKATRELPSDRFETANDFAAALRHRHYGFYGVLAAAGAVLLAVALFIAFRAELAARIKPVVRPDPVVSLGRQQAESDSAYLTRLLPVAENGHAAAQLAVAEAYFNGRGTPTNRVEAVKWYRRAAASGEVSAQASMGLCCLRGWGCARDQAEAVRWYSMAAAQGNLMAMNDLAFCFLHGLGVEKDEKIGFSWALRAAKSGFAPAQTMVGECYWDGRGVAEDAEAGQAWLCRAALQGNLRAQQLLESR